jgi:3-methyladenine DNA glycosylase AlkC
VSRKLTKETMLADLAKLGDTSDAVAAKLKQLGCEGERVSSRSCPIAKYLLRLGYDKKLQVERCWVLCAKEEVYIHNNIFNFLGRFDVGMYPELISPC